MRTYVSLLALVFCVGPPARMGAEAGPPRSVAAARARNTAMLLAGLPGSAVPPLPQIRAQEQVPRLQAQVDTTVVTVGDPITLLVSVEHAPDARVVWPDSVDLSPFEVLAARAAGPSTRDGVSRSSLALTLAAYELGDLEIPGFQVDVVGPQGDSTVLDTNPFGVRVQSVGLDEGGDIRALKGPMGLPLDPARLALWGLGLLLLAAVALAAYRRWGGRGSGESGETSPTVPARPPHEIALEALARLEASPLLERGEVKEFHIQVSDIVRAYVEGRFRVPALEMTTRDILSGLERVGVEPSVRKGFTRFLDQCDMVKFAKHRPDAHASRGVLALGRKLVEETIPAPGTPAVAEGQETGEPDADAAEPQGDAEPAEEAGGAHEPEAPPAREGEPAPDPAPVTPREAAP